MPKLLLVIATAILNVYSFTHFGGSHASTQVGTLEHCFYSYSDSLATHHEVEMQIQSDDVMISGRLFLPDTTGTHPVAVLMQGGGNHVERLRATPFYFGPRLAHCGIAAFAYDKRGTGDSGGDYNESNFDDFVTDAGRIAGVLAKTRGINPEQIGMVGFSQGGRLAPVVAVRYEEVSFVVSVSGPLTSAEATRIYALENNFKSVGIPDSVITRVMPTWHAHFAAIAAQDQTALSKLDVEIETLREQFHSSLIPPFSSDIPRTGIYNSVGRDYSTELAKLDVPWFSLYGAEDIVVPVQESVAILRERMKAAGHEDVMVNIIPNCSHSFMHTETNEPIDFEAMIVDWMLNRMTNQMKPRGSFD